MIKSTRISAGRYEITTEFPVKITLKQIGGLWEIHTNRADGTTIRYNRQFAQKREAMEMAKRVMNFVLREYEDAARRGYGNQPQQAIKDDSMIMTKKRAYEVLGLPETASRDQIQKKWKAMVAKVHPDNGGSTFFAIMVNNARDELMKWVK